MSDQKDEKVEKKQIPSKDIIALLDKFREDSEEDNNIDYGEDHVKQLESAYHQLGKNFKFEVGQLVKWKRNLKNRRFPRENQPAIVLEVLQTPTISEEPDIGSPYFREQNDLILGLLDKSGNMFTFYYDSRRFEPFESK
ncbi:MAG: hypothetical protein RIT27_2318 [Pseudomonadota bacterium]|jgi:hypothetical protein